jgi:hypothetical protein
MNLIETTYKTTEGGFEHTVQFEFEERQFIAFINETPDELFIRDCFLVLDNFFPIDIPKYFGEFKGEVYTFIYDNVSRGFTGFE